MRTENRIALNAARETKFRDCRVPAQIWLWQFMNEHNGFLQRPATGDG